MALACLMVTLACVTGSMSTACRPAFRDPILKDGASLDRQQIEKAVLRRTHGLLKDNPKIGAFVFECHNLAPYARIVQETHKKPVFDIIDFAIWVYSSIRKRTYPTPANA